MKHERRLLTDQRRDGKHACVSKTLELGKDLRMHIGTNIQRIRTPVLSIGSFFPKLNTRIAYATVDGHKAVHAAPSATKV